MEIEYDTPLLRDELRAKMDAEGNHSIPITKTMLWFYAVDQERQKDPKNFPFDDIDYVKADPPDELKNARRERPRILAIGTKRELGFRTQAIVDVGTTDEGDKVLGLGSKNVTEHINLSSLVDQKLAELCRRHNLSDEVDVTFCSQAMLFWSAFFLNDQFLDSEVLLPQLIVITGSIRSQCDYGEWFGNSTHDIIERIVAIGRRWNIPVESAL